MRRGICLVAGCIGLGLGVIGTVMPIVPTVPFLMLAAICFGKSSKKLDNWFKGTKLYRDNLESYAEGKGMTKKTKIRIMIMVTLMMAIGFAMMGNVPVGRIVLTGVWIFHILYFCFGIKTLKPVYEG